MGKNKLLRIFQWGWQGIKVWSVLISLGVPAMVMAVFHSIFSGWTWYDQFFLFVGIGLIVLGILAAILARSRIKMPKPLNDTQASIVEDRQALLEFYDRQKENWKSNLRLRIRGVKPVIDGDVPKVIFEMEMINYLPVTVKLVKVIHSSGSVNASVLGSCELPALPETIDERIHACSERQFTLQLEVGKTNVPDFLRPKLVEPGQLLQWTLKGEWYIEIDGKIVVWATQSYQLMYNQVIVKQDVA